MPNRELVDVGIVRLIVALLCVATGVSAALVIGVIALNRPVSWFLGGFEIVVLLASVVGSMLAFGRFREGPAITLLCVAGAVGVGSLLGYIGAGKSLAGWDLKPFLLIRAIDAALMAALAGVIVLARTPRASFSALARGVIFGGALLVIVGGAWALRGAISTSPGPVRAVVLVAVGLAAVGLVSASAHYLVRAFAVGTEPRSEQTT